ncbi:hypothetical protein NN484_25000 [Pseudomonas serboccidentalis]|uniref:Inactive Sirtuin domain-containing protein n=1 Tax=Pseudomonas serboccidentalis TaxID=2964670 RepID=A0ABY7Z884_9PSED|nr:hypothetical protein [Pseudomonas serboccidentalis]WDR35710.1 hypothetical protein NN484_25000 [Pseudomonas serboccidentalis]
MVEIKVITLNAVPNSLITSIESRDVSLWVRDIDNNKFSAETLAKFIGLPWRSVFMESYCPEVIKLLESSLSFEASETRKRGFIQVVDSDPSAITLPHRCLPLYLLSGRSSLQTNDFKSKLRRMSMLNVLQESQVRNVLVIGEGVDAVPAALGELWDSGFKSYLTVCTTVPGAINLLEQWVDKHGDTHTANFLHRSIDELSVEVVSRYHETYPDTATMVRMRQRDGGFRNVDLSSADDPQRPISENYSIIQLKDLSPLVPEDLPEEEFIDFFKNSEDSWKPYAAGVPWIRDKAASRKLTGYMNRLDATGADDNCIAYIASESGAGGTTLARALAWELAREGYPVLIAKHLPFTPDALSVSNFLTRAHECFETGASAVVDSGEGEVVTTKGSASKRYETPWVILFDSLHWQGRDAELQRFNQELIKSGRPACLLVVTGTVLGLSYYSSVFKKLAELNHAIDEESTRDLGRHLNKFLKVYGKVRNEAQWNNFYKSHSVEYIEGVAAFWVALSFWIQGQYDLSESIQTWMYRNFKESTDSVLIQRAVVEIAALSSERLPLPEGLLISEPGQWPTSHLLEDQRAALSSLGLVKVAANGERYWALTHDILGRFLLNAIFYDNAMKILLGLDAARDAEHLRFLVLEQISQKSQLGEVRYRTIGEDFSKSIFKIDPAHGRANFLFFWREVLDALDRMPSGLRNTSRVFRHHTAISRRRIAKIDERSNTVSSLERKELLQAAIVDIRYALEFIQYEPGSEPDINLYNSLANAYLDLARIQTALEEPKPDIIENMLLASVATKKAYDQNPSSPFVIETYVKHLLEEASLAPVESAIGHCVEILGVLFSALSSNSHTRRNVQLQSLADEAIRKLFRLSPFDLAAKEPENAIDMLVNAWKILARDFPDLERMDFSMVSKETRSEAIDLLSHSLGVGNIQVLSLRYELISLNEPYGYKGQLEILEQIVSSNYRAPLQLSLEYAILLFQVGRAVEGDRIFRDLRRTWRDSEYYVQVPTRLRWLRIADSDQLQVVHAETGSDYEKRSLAKVQEFVNVAVPFRVQEFGHRELKPGIRFFAHVSFGHNGPFLRPVLSSTQRDE